MEQHKTNCNENQFADILVRVRDCSGYFIDRPFFPEIKGLSQSIWWEHLQYECSANHLEHSAHKQGARGDIAREIIKRMYQNVFEQEETR